MGYIRIQFNESPKRMVSVTTQPPRYKVIEQGTGTYGIKPPSADLKDQQEDRKRNCLLAWLMTAAFVLLVIFMICVYLKVDGRLGDSSKWSLFLIPFILSLIPLGWCAYLYIRKQVGLVQESLFCMEITIFGLFTACCIVQVFLLLLKADRYIAAGYMLVCIPMYGCIVAILLFLVIILPFFICCDSSFHYYGILALLYIVTSSCTVYYLVRLLDYPSLKIPMYAIFIPIWTALVIHLLLSIFLVKGAWTTSCILGILIVYSLFQYLPLQGLLIVPWWALTLLFAISLAAPILVLNQSFLCST